MHCCMKFKNQGGISNYLQNMELGVKQQYMALLKNQLFRGNLFLGKNQCLKALQTSLKD